jgi:surface carbohydrate biosynthesis protein
MRKTHITSRRWLIIPIETKARELHAKVFLACVAAENGWGVILGEATVIRDKQKWFPKGVFLEKSIHPDTEKLLETSISCGNRVSAWCEEGLIYYGKDDYCERRLKLESFDMLDLFFAWGKNQAEDITSTLHRPMDKIVLSGNPRFDLLRPELRGIFSKNAAKIHSKYGPIILINTKFPLCNFNMVGVNRIEQMKSSGLIKTQARENIMNRSLVLQNKLLSSFIHLIPLLAKRFPKHTIIIRPHPSENHVPWIEFAKDYKNVKIIFEGNVNEWILASDIMIHNNCTTGVEAFMLGKPAISYRPYIDETVEHPLPDQVSYSISNEEELITFISQVISEKPFTKDLEQKCLFASGYISNLDGKLASDRIVEKLDQLELNSIETRLPIKSPIYDFKRLLINTIKPDRYALQKFPGLEHEELMEILTNLQQTTGRFAKVKFVSADNKNCFCFF